METSDPHTHEVAPPAGTSASRRGIWVVVLLGLGLGGWIGVRVMEATTKQKAVEQEHAAVAKAAVENAARPPSVKVVRGTRATWQPVITLDGSLAPAREADVGFKTGGRVGSIRAKVGDRVRQGAVLAELDSREATANVASATAQAEAAEAQLALAVDADKRTAAIVSSGAQAEAVGVQAHQQRVLAEAQRNAARAGLELARSMLANHSLTAPFAGTVARAPTGAGGVVAPGMQTSPTFHLEDLSTLKLVGTIGEADAPLVKVGTPVDVPGPDGRTVRGKVVAVVPSLDPATRRLPVEAQIPNSADAPLLARSMVHATIKGSHPVDVLTLPRGVIRPGSQDEVMIVKGDRLVARRIDFVIDRDGSILVRRGLDAGDDVVAEPWAEAKDGDRVALAAPALGERGDK
jgi:RND family efflux transporter MFP subunit